MAHLPAEVRRCFKSDMRIVVDYLAEGKVYLPTKQKIVHIEALLRMLRALSGDKRFEEIWEQLSRTEETEGTSMCELFNQYPEEDDLSIAKRLLADN